MTTPPNLQQVSYFSRSLIRGPRWFVETELERLLIVIRERNEYFAITGSLMFSDGCFAQILEGPAASIDHLFGTIQNDHRHGDVTLLSRQAVAERTFPDWSMQYIASPSDVGAAGPSTGLFQQIGKAMRGNLG